MFFIQKEYFQYLLHSTNQHGVHSPFLFKFITSCVYLKPSKEQEYKFNEYKRELLQSKDVLEVEDFGAGSKVFKSNKRKVSQIAKVAGIKTKYGLLLMRMMSYFNVQNCLEIGTSLGMASNCLYRWLEDFELTTLEGCKSTLEYAQRNMEKKGNANVNYIAGNFDTTLKNVCKNKIYDFVFFDGNHTKKATLDYFKVCLTSKHNDSVFVFDDIHWSKEMKEAWHEIKKHPEVTVTMDLFQWGVVFFRKEQRKEHFTIRY